MASGLLDHGRRRFFNQPARRVSVGEREEVEEGVGQGIPLHPMAALAVPQGPSTVEQQPSSHDVVGAVPVGIMAAQPGSAEGRQPTVSFGPVVLHPGIQQAESTPTSTGFAGFASSSQPIDPPAHLKGEPFTSSPEGLAASSGTTTQRPLTQSWTDVAQRFNFPPAIETPSAAYAAYVPRSADQQRQAVPPVLAQPTAAVAQGQGMQALFASGRRRPMGSGGSS